MTDDINKKPFNPRPWNAKDDTSNIPDQNTPDINNITASGVNLRIDGPVNRTAEAHIIAGLELTFRQQRDEIAGLKNRLVDLDRSNTDLQHKLGECGERNTTLRSDNARLQGALHSAEQRNFVYGELVTNLAKALGKATNEILKGLSEPQIEPQYRMLVVGEVIEEGDEYLDEYFDNFAWRASACAGDTFHPTVGGGKHYPHRRKITP